MLAPPKKEITSDKVTGYATFCIDLTHLAQLDSCAVIFVDV